MAWAKIGVVNEKWQPLAGVQVEAYKLDDPTSVIELQTTDRGGVALFVALSTDRFFFKTRATRASGTFGEASLSGVVRLQILASSGATCADAYVDPTGNFGTDATIQAAITRLGTGSGRYTIFIAGGTYTEALTISSTTASFELTGCGATLTSWPFTLPYAPGIQPLGVKINGGSSAALTASGSKDVTIKGIEIYNSSAGTATVNPSGASANLLFDNCYIHNDNASGSAIVSSTGPAQMRLQHCVVQGGVGADAINVGTATTNVTVDVCSLQGRIVSTGFSCSVVRSTISVTNATNAIIPGASRGIVQHCRLEQLSTGNGIELSNAGSVAFHWFFDNNQIEGTSAGSGIKIGNNHEAMVTANGIVNWSKGVEISATGCAVQLRGNIFGSVTTPVSGKPYFIGARAYNNNTAQTLANNTVTTITLDAESYDPGNVYDTGTYTYTVPVTGKYHIDAAILFTAPAATAGHANVLIMVNGAAFVQGAIIPLTTGALCGPTVSGDLELTQGDAITIAGFQLSGGNLALSVVAGGYRNYFNIHLLQQ